MKVTGATIKDGEISLTFGEAQSAESELEKWRTKRRAS
jgi:hypothetical protein